MSYEVPFNVFCEKKCPYRNNRQLEPERWQHLSPCVNCPAESFAEYLEENTSTNGKTIHIKKIDTLSL